VWNNYYILTGICHGPYLCKTAYQAPTAIIYEEKELRKETLPGQIRDF